LIHAYPQVELVYKCGHRWTHIANTGTTTHELLAERDRAATELCPNCDGKPELYIGWDYQNERYRTP
jgi:hypothetical protein